MKKIYQLIIALLITGIALHIFYLARIYVPNLISVRSNLGKASVWRGANFNQSEKVADFIYFLNQNIPENARVVLPSLGSSRKILKTPYMQLFLAPREVINCSNVECFQTLSREKTYLVIVGDLPSDIMQDGSTLMFDENRGVLIPDSFSDERVPSSVKDFNSMGEFLWNSAWPLLWLAVLTLTGSIFVISFLPEQEKLLQIALGYGMGLGIFSLGVVVLTLLGFSLNKGLVIGTTAVLLCVAISISVMEQRHKKSIAVTEKPQEQKSKLDFLPLIFISFGVVAVALAVGKGYHSLDAIQIWGAKGYGIAASGSLDSVTDWGTNTLAYPLHIPVIIAAFRILFGDVLPSSKMIFGGYYLALMLVMYYILLKIGVKGLISCLAVAMMMTAPLIFRHATIGYANLVLTYYLVSGVSLFVLASKSNLSKRNLFLSSFFLVCAAWTRPEGLMLALGSVGVLILLAFIYPETSWSWRRLVSFISPLIIYILFWQFVKIQVYPAQLSNTNLALEAMQKIFIGNLHISEALYILGYFVKELINPNVFGLVGLLIISLVILIIISRKSITWPAGMLMAVGGLWIVMIMGMYYLVSFDAAHDLSWWVISGLNRMSFPGLITLWLGLIATISKNKTFQLDIPL